MSDRKVLVMNEKDTIPTKVAVADLQRIVKQNDPDFGVLNEWNRARDRATRAMLASLGYGYGRPLLGGGPVFWRRTTARKRSIRSKMIAKPGRVGKLPGRRSWLGPSWLTIGKFDLLEGGKPNGSTVVLDGFHMTAEVQMGDHYRTDPAHRLRVLRHKTERAMVEHVAGRQQDKDPNAEVLPAGDSNFDGMALDGFHNCWEGRHGGDLGGRAVTQCFASREARLVETFRTNSDHLAVVVTY